MQLSLLLLLLLPLGSTLCAAAASARAGSHCGAHTCCFLRRYTAAKCTLLLGCTWGRR